MVNGTGPDLPYDAMQGSPHFYEGFVRMDGSPALGMDVIFFSFFGLHLHLAKKSSKNPAQKNTFSNLLQVFNFVPPQARTHAAFANKQFQFDQTCLLKED